MIDKFINYYQKHPAWGSLHIVLSDGNIKDHSVQSCIELAEQNHDYEGAELAKLLLIMSKTQRKKLPYLVRRSYEAK